MTNDKVLRCANHCNIRVITFHFIFFVAFFLSLRSARIVKFNAFIWFDLQKNQISINRQFGVSASMLCIAYRKVNHVCMCVHDTYDIFHTDTHLDSSIHYSSVNESHKSLHIKRWMAKESDSFQFFLFFFFFFSFSLCSFFILLHPQIDRIAFFFSFCFFFFVFFFLSSSSPRLFCARIISVSLLTFSVFLLLKNKWNSQVNWLKIAWNLLCWISKAIFHTECWINYFNIFVNDVTKCCWTFQLFFFFNVFFCFWYFFSNKVKWNEILGITNWLMLTFGLSDVITNIIGSIPFFLSFLFFHFIASIIGVWPTENGNSVADMFRYRGPKKKHENENEMDFKKSG